MVAAVGAALCEDENSGAASLHKIIMVAVGRIFARLYISHVATFGVHSLHLFEKCLGVVGLGVEHDDSIVTAAEKVDIHHHLNVV